MRLIFMGTSKFAVPSLNQIHLSYHKILAVVTQPDRPKGRGQKISRSPVKKTAFNLGYKVLQPNNINQDQFIRDIESLKPDLFVVVAFGQILCKKLLKLPKKGAVNVHPSLIPKYRGAAPIQWAIINGDRETGVTTILMDKGMDTGCVLMSKITNIRPYENSISLQDRLSNIGSSLLLETIEKLNDNSLNPMPQDSNYNILAPSLKKQDGEINWNDSAYNIECFIRGMNPWPGAFTFYNSILLKIISADVITLDFKESPGTILKLCKKKLIIATGKDAISVTMIQGKSGKLMSIDAFLCGFRFKNSSIMGKNENS